jgi:hypothetical protein
MVAVARWRGGAVAVEGLIAPWNRLSDLGNLPRINASSSFTFSPRMVIYFRQPNRVTNWALSEIHLPQKQRKHRAVKMFIGWKGSISTKES